MSTSKGVWLTKELIQDKKLSWTKKIILQEIEQLSELEHGCFANNRHFAELLGISKSAVSMALKELENDGYIEINNDETVRNFGRKITIKTGVKQTEQGLSQLNRGVKQTEQSPIKQTEQSKETNSYKTKTKENKKTSKKENFPQKLQEWVDYRREIKKPLKSPTIAKLKKRHDDNPALFAQAVDHSIENGYQGLFEPKQKHSVFNEPEAGSIGWMMQQDQCAVDVEVYDA